MALRVAAYVGFARQVPSIPLLLLDAWGIGWVYFFVASRNLDRLSGRFLSHQRATKSGEHNEKP